MSEEEPVTRQDGTARPGTVEAHVELPAATIFVGLSDAVALTLVTAALGIVVTISAVLVATAPMWGRALWAIGAAAAVSVVLFVGPTRAWTIRSVQRWTRTVAT